MLQSKINLSIIIPVHDSCATVGSLLKTIISARMDGVEVIIIDDDSDDELEDIVNQFVRRSSKLPVEYCKVHFRNAGLSRQFGLSKATGRYIFFCDADDQLQIENFITAYEWLMDMDSNCDVLWCNYYSVSNGVKTKAQHLSRDTCSLNLKRERGIYGFHDVNSFKVLWNKFYRRSFLLTNSIKFNDKITGEDACFNLDTFDCNPKVAYFNKPIYLYNAHNINSLTSEHLSADAFDREKVLIDRIEQSFSKLGNSRLNSFANQERVLSGFVLARNRKELTRSQFLTSLEALQIGLLPKVVGVKIQIKQYYVVAIRLQTKIFATLEGL